MERKKSKRGKASVNSGVHGRVTATAKKKTVKGMADQEERDRIEAANVLSSFQFLSPKEEDVDSETRDVNSTSNRTSSPQMTHLSSAPNSGKSEHVAPSLNLEQGRQLQQIIQLLKAGSNPAEKVTQLQQIANRTIAEIYSHLAQLQRSQLAQWSHNSEQPSEQTLPPPNPVSAQLTATDAATHMKLPLFIQQPRVAKATAAPRMPASQTVTVNKNVATALRRAIPDIRPSSEMSISTGQPQGLVLPSLKEKQVGENISPALPSRILREAFSSKTKNNTPPPLMKKTEASSDTNLPLKKRRIIELKGLSDSQSLESIDSTEPLTSIDSNYKPTTQQLESILNLARNYPVSAGLGQLMNSTISDIPGQNTKGSGYVPFKFDPRTSLMVLSDLKYALTPDDDGDLPLHIAVVHENLELVKKFVDIMGMSGKTVDRYNKLLQTPLHLAVLVCDVGIVGALLDEGADPNLVDRHGCTAAHLAVTKGCAKCLSTILDHSTIKCDLNTRNYEGYTALHTAVELDDCDLVTLLQQHGADINAQDGKAGRSVLYYATEYNRIAIIKFLVANRANVELQNYAGISPLMNVQVQGQQAMATLLQKGSDDTKVHDDMAHTSTKKTVIPRIPSKASLIIPGSTSRSRSNSLTEDDVKPKFLHSYSIPSATSSPMDLSSTRDTGSPGDPNRMYKLTLSGKGKDLADVKRKHPQIMAFLDGKVKPPYISYSTCTSPVKRVAEITKMDVSDSEPPTVEDPAIVSNEHNNFGDGISWPPIKTETDNRAKFLRISPSSTSITDDWVQKQDKNLMCKLNKFPDKTSVESETFSIVSDGDAAIDMRDTVPETVIESIPENNSNKARTPGSIFSCSYVEIGPSDDIVSSNQGSPSMPVLSRLCSVADDNDIVNPELIGEEQSREKNTYEVVPAVETENLDIPVLSITGTISESKTLSNAQGIEKQISQDSVISKFGDQGDLSSQGFDIHSSQESSISKSDDSLKFGKQSSQELSSESNEGLMEQHIDTIAVLKNEVETCEIKICGEYVHTFMETKIQNTVDNSSDDMGGDKVNNTEESMDSFELNEDPLHENEDSTETMVFESVDKCATHYVECQTDNESEPLDEVVEEMDDSQDILIIDEGRMVDVHNHTMVANTQNGEHFETVNETAETVVRTDDMDSDKSKPVDDTVNYLRSSVHDQATGMEVSCESVKKTVENISTSQMHETSTCELTASSMDVRSSYVTSNSVVNKEAQEAEDENQVLPSSSGSDRISPMSTETAAVVTSSDINEGNSMLMCDQSPNVHTEKKHSITQHILRSDQEKTPISEVASDEAALHGQTKTDAVSMLGQPRMLYYHDGTTFQPIPIYVDESVRCSKLLQNMFKTSAMKVTQANVTNLANLTTEPHVEPQTVTASSSLTHRLQSDMPKSIVMSASSSSSMVSSGLSISSSIASVRLPEASQSSYSSVSSLTNNEGPIYGDENKFVPDGHFSDPSSKYRRVPQSLGNETAAGAHDTNSASINIDIVKRKEKLEKHLQRARNAPKLLSASGHHILSAEKTEPVTSVVISDSPVTAIDNQDVHGDSITKPAPLPNEIPPLINMQKHFSQMYRKGVGKRNPKKPTQTETGMSKLATVLSEAYTPLSLKSQSSLTSFSSLKPSPSSRTVSVTSEGTLTRVNPDIRNKLSKALQSPRRRLLPASVVFDEDQNFPTVVHRALSESTDAVTLFSSSSGVDSVVSSPKHPVQLTTRLPL